jgi:hypothetical protein
MELLSDDNASDMSAKEIMRRWEQRGKVPMAANPAPSPGNLSGTASRKDQRNAPQITQAVNNPQPNAGEASVRQIPGSGQQPYGVSHSQQHSPNPQHDMGTPNPPYGQNAQASAESHRTGSPHRHSYRSPAYQKQIGAAGAS